MGPQRGKSALKGNNNSRPTRIRRLQKSKETIQKPMKIINCNVEKMANKKLYYPSCSVSLVDVGSSDLATANTLSDNDSKELYVPSSTTKCKSLSVKRQLNDHCVDLLQTCPLVRTSPRKNFRSNNFTYTGNTASAPHVKHCNVTAAVTRSRTLSVSPSAQVASSANFETSPLPTTSSTYVSVITPKTSVSSASSLHLTTSNRQYKVIIQKNNAIISQMKVLCCECKQYPSYCKCKVTSALSDSDNTSSVSKSSSACSGKEYLPAVVYLEPLHIPHSKSQQDDIGYIKQLSISTEKEICSSRMKSMPLSKRLKLQTQTFVSVSNSQSMKVKEKLKQMCHHNDVIGKSRSVNATMKSRQDDTYDSSNNSDSSCSTNLETHTLGSTSNSKVLRDSSSDNACVSQSRKGQKRKLCRSSNVSSKLLKLKHQNNMEEHLKSGKLPKSYIPNSFKTPDIMKSHHSHGHLSYGSDSKELLLEPVAKGSYFNVSTDSTERSLSDSDQEVQSCPSSKPKQEKKNVNLLCDNVSVNSVCKDSLNDKIVVSNYPDKEKDTGETSERKVHEDLNPVESSKHVSRFSSKHKRYKREKLSDKVRNTSSSRRDKNKSLIDQNKVLKQNDKGPDNRVGVCREPVKSNVSLVDNTADYCISSQSSSKHKGHKQEKFCRSSADLSANSGNQKSLNEPKRGLEQVGRELGKSVIESTNSSKDLQANMVNSLNQQLPKPASKHNKKKVHQSHRHVPNHSSNDKLHKGNEVASQNIVNSDRVSKSSTERNCMEDSNPVDSVLLLMRKHIENNNLAELVQGKNVTDVIKVLFNCSLDSSTSSTNHSNPKQCAESVSITGSTSETFNRNDDHLMKDITQDKTAQLYHKIHNKKNEINTSSKSKMGQKLELPTKPFGNTSTSDGCDNDFSATSSPVSSSTVVKNIGKAVPETAQRLLPFDHIGKDSEESVKQSILEKKTVTLTSEAYNENNLQNSISGRGSVNIPLDSSTIQSHKKSRMRSTSHVSRKSERHELPVMYSSISKSPGMLQELNSNCSAAASSVLSHDTKSLNKVIGNVQVSESKQNKTSKMKQIGAEITEVGGENIRSLATTSSNKNKIAAKRGKEREESGNTVNRTVISQHWNDVTKATDVIYNTSSSAVQRKSYDSIQNCDGTDKNKHYSSGAQCLSVGLLELIPDSKKNAKNSNNYPVFELNKNVLPSGTKETDHSKTILSSSKKGAGGDNNRSSGLAAFTSAPNKGSIHKDLKSDEHEPLGSSVSDGTLKSEVASRIRTSPRRPKHNTEKITTKTMTRRHLTSYSDNLSKSFDSDTVQTNNILSSLELSKSASLPLLRNEDESVGLTDISPKCKIDTPTRTKPSEYNSVSFDDGRSEEMYGSSDAQTAPLSINQNIYSKLSDESSEKLNERKQQFNKAKKYITQTTICMPLLDKPSSEVKSPHKFRINRISEAVKIKPVNDVSKVDSTGNVGVVPLQKTCNFIMVTKKPIPINTAHTSPERGSLTPVVTSNDNISISANHFHSSPGTDAGTNVNISVNISPELLESFGSKTCQYDGRSSFNLEDSLVEKHHSSVDKPEQTFIPRRVANGKTSSEMPGQYMFCSTPEPVKDTTSIRNIVSSCPAITTSLQLASLPTTTVSSKTTNAIQSMEPLGIENKPVSEMYRSEKGNVCDEECDDGISLFAETLFSRVESVGHWNVLGRTQGLDHEIIAKNPFILSHNVGESSDKNISNNEMGGNDKHADCFTSLEQNDDCHSDGASGGVDEYSGKSSDFSVNNERSGSEASTDCCDGLKQKSSEVEEALVCNVEKEASVDNFSFIEDREIEQEGYVVEKTGRGSPTESFWETQSLLNYATWNTNLATTQCGVQRYGEPAVRLEDEVKVPESDETEKHADSYDRNVSTKAAELPLSGQNTGPLNRTTGLSEASPNNPKGRQLWTLTRGLSKAASGTQEAKQLLDEARGLTETSPASQTATSFLKRGVTFESAESCTDYVPSRKSNGDRYEDIRTLLTGSCYRFLTYGACQNKACRFKHQAPTLSGQDQQILLKYIDYARSQRYWYLMSCVLSALVESVNISLRLSGFDLWLTILDMLVSKNVTRLAALNVILTYMLDTRDISSINFIFDLILFHNSLAQSWSLVRRLADIPGIEFPKALVERGLCLLDHSRSREECVHMFSLIECMIHSTVTFSQIEPYLLNSCVEKLDFFGLAKEANFLRCNVSSFHGNGFAPEFGRSLSSSQIVSVPQFTHPINDSRRHLGVGTFDRNSSNVSWPQQNLQSCSDLRGFLERKRKLNQSERPNVDVSEPGGMQNLKLDNRYDASVQQGRITSQPTVRNHQNNGVIQSLVPEGAGRQGMVPDGRKMHLPGERDGIFKIPFLSRKKIHFTDHVAEDEGEIQDRLQCHILPKKNICSETQERKNAIQVHKEHFKRKTVNPSGMVCDPRLRNNVSEGVTSQVPPVNELIHPQNNPPIQSKVCSSNSARLPQKDIQLNLNNRAVLKNSGNFGCENIPKSDKVPVIPNRSRLQSLTYPDRIINSSLESGEKQMSDVIYPGNQESLCFAMSRSDSRELGLSPQSLVEHGRWRTSPELNKSFRLQRPLISIDSAIPNNTMPLHSRMARHSPYHNTEQELYDSRTAVHQRLSGPTLHNQWTGGKIDLSPFSRSIEHPLQPELEVELHHLHQALRNGALHDVAELLIKWKEHAMIGSRFANEVYKILALEVHKAGPSFSKLVQMTGNERNKEMKMMLSSIGISLIFDLFELNMHFEAFKIYNIMKINGINLFESVIFKNEEISQFRKAIYVCEICISVKKFSEAFTILISCGMLSPNVNCWKLQSVPEDYKFREEICTSLLHCLTNGSVPKLAYSYCIEIIKAQPKTFSPIDVRKHCNKLMLTLLEHKMIQEALILYSKIEKEFSSLCNPTYRSLIVACVLEGNHQLAMKIYKAAMHMNTYPKQSVEGRPLHIKIYSYCLKEEIFIIVEHFLHQLSQELDSDSDSDNPDFNHLNLSIYVEVVDVNNCKLDNQLPVILQNVNTTLEGVKERIHTALRNKLNPPLSAEFIPRDRTIHIEQQSLVEYLKCLMNQSAN